MTKRAPGKFKRRKQDAYDTPSSAVLPLLPHLPPKCKYVEPCAGFGAITEPLYIAGHRCVEAFDIDPRDEDIDKLDALTAPISMLAAGSHIITNPPWTRQILHPMIDRFSAIRPTWLLFDADWMHTRQAAPYMVKCVKIVSVGRVSWMQNGTSGLDNCAWYLFDANHIGPTVFWGRT